MSKNLEQLLKIKKDLSRLQNDYLNIFQTCYFKHIEEALEEYEQHEEILNDYGLTLVDFREACLLSAMLKGEGRTIRNIDKQLEALEIIKTKRVNIHILLESNNVEEYNDSVYVCEGIKYKLIQEEYDLLKEVLL